MKSIIPQEQGTCFLCEAFQEHNSNILHEHHIFEGCRRKKSEQYGLKVNLCMTHHTGDINGNKKAVHFNKEYDLMLKEMAQRVFEETHTREEFRKEFGKSWL